jgi:hypothetical protein
MENNTSKNFLQKPCMFIAGNTAADLAFNVPDN